MIDRIVAGGGLRNLILLFVAFPVLIVTFGFHILLLEKQQWQDLFMRLQAGMDSYAQIARKQN